MNTIETIRAEVVRLIKECDGSVSQYGFGKESACNRILNFLDTLQEKSEKPINPVLQDFPTTEKEMQDFLATHERIPVPERLNSLERILQEQPVCEDLETEALRSAGVLLSEHFEDEDDDAIRTTALRCWKGGFIAGASWQKEQMMENALHGWLDEDNEPPYDLNVLCEEKIPFGKFKHCDKVKIIIVKED